MSIEYRHPTEADIEAMTNIVNTSNKELPLHRDESEEEMRVWTFGEDDYDPKGYLLALVDGEPVGYGGTVVSRSRQESGMKDAFIGVSVTPEHRGKGIEQHLMEHALAFMKERGVEYAKRWCSLTSGWRHDISLEFGMKDVRHGYVMIYDQNAPPPDVPLPEGMRYEHTVFKEASDEIIKQFVEGFNDSFFDHYNFSSVPVDRFIKARDTDREPARITFAKEGDNIVGVLLVEESTIYNKENGTKVGWADILGVMSQYRKKGVGRALLSNGMKWILDQGMDTIYLGMDAENAKALDLYTSLGFKVEQEGISYQLDI